MRTLLVEADKTFKVDIPDEARVTYGPWSPPKKRDMLYGDSPRNPAGTLRVYSNARQDSIIACFSGVTSFRDITQVEYAEQVAKEEGATIWKSDAEGYSREEKISRAKEWKSDTKLIDGLVQRAKKGK